MKLLKDAFVKAGLVTKEEADKRTHVERRPVIRKPAPRQERQERQEYRQRPQQRDFQPRKPAPVRHAKEEMERFHEHQIRTECEHCKNHAPDIEFYRHTNRLITANWLCIKCADDAKISDDTRETAQSSYAKSNRFRRMWGKTRMAGEFKTNR